ncbi:MAG: DUF2029 domain-containing protein [Pseudomonadales bacterium]|nr:DUF2029 domain-containing protein [Pseudomonadales bacterium]
MASPARSLIKSISEKRSTLFLVLLGLYFIDPVGIWYIIEHKMAVDLRSFYFAAKAVELGQSPYQVQYLQTLSEQIGLTDYVYPYLYPPILAQLFKPFLFLPVLWVGPVYLIINSLAMAGTLILSIKILLHSEKCYSKNQLAIIAALTLLAVPLHTNLTLGQINMPVLLLIMAAFYCSYNRSCHLLAGSFLALACFIKITPAGFILFFLLDKRYKVVLGCLLTLAMGLVLSLLSDGGINLWLAFFHSFIDTASNDTGSLTDKVAVANISLLSVTGQMFGKNTGILITLISLSVLGLMLLRISIKTIKTHRWLLILPWFSLMLLASPILYTHHLIYCYPGLFISISYGYKKCNKPQRIIGLGFILTLGIDWPFWNHFLGFHVLSLQAMNLLLLIILLLLQLFFLNKLTKD